MKKRKRIYADYAASTPVDVAVKRAMAPYWSDQFGNPGSLHEEGMSAKRALDEARSCIGSQIGARADEIIFTSGGTESNNLAIFGLVRALLSGGKSLADFHFITSTIEHPSVLDCFKELEARGAAVTYCGVTAEGLTEPEEVRNALRQNTALVSFAYVNNEIGTIQPLKQISKSIVQKNKDRFFQSCMPLFHTDASQAPLYLDCGVEKLGIDMMTIDGQKMYGPKGIGFLFIKRGLPLAPILFGGSQERGMRPGTPPLPLIVGCAKAFEQAQTRRAKEAKRLTVLRDHLLAEIKKHVPTAELNGSATERAPNNINISFPGVSNEFLVLQLDAKGIAVGTRSACLSGVGSGSYVIEALGKGSDFGKSSIRITFGIHTTRADVDYCVKTLVDLIRD